MDQGGSAETLSTFQRHLVSISTGILRLWSTAPSRHTPCHLLPLRRKNSSPCLQVSHSLQLKALGSISCQVGDDLTSSPSRGQKHKSCRFSGCPIKQGQWCWFSCKKKRHTDLLVSYKSLSSKALLPPGVFSRRRPTALSQSVSKSPVSVSVPRSLCSLPSLHQPFLPPQVLCLRWVSAALASEWPLFRAGEILQSRSTYHPGQLQETGAEGKKCKCII